MSKTVKKPLTFYPAYCFSASPTFNAWVKLTAAGVHALSSRRGFEGQGIYFYRNHPVQWIQVTGLVVDFEPNDLYWLFHVDDGSGSLVEVVLPRKKIDAVPLAQPGEAITLVPQRKLGISALGNEINLDKLDIGSIVKVKGGIREFRNVKQIALERLFFVRDTFAEVQAWESSAIQYESVLAHPWVLTTSQERALKARAQGKSRKRDPKNRDGQRQDERSAATKSKEIATRSRQGRASTSKASSKQ